MKLLIVGEFSYGSLGLSYYNAFNKLISQVTRFDYIEELRAISKLLRIKYFFRLLSPWSFKILNDKLLRMVHDIQPDLILIIKGTIILPRTLIEIKKITQAQVFNFNPDNPFNLNSGASNNLIRESIPYYDCYFIWGRFLMSELLNKKARRVEYLPFGYDPILHYPVIVNDKEKKIYGNDLVFVGTWDKEREAFLAQVADYDLAIWGTGWENIKWNSPLKSKLKHDFAIGLDFAKICNSSKIVLNHIRKQNGDAHNMRTFEVPACKGFMLTTRTKEQCEFFEEDKEIVCFETPNELRIKIDKYISLYNVREEFKLNAYKKVQNCTYIERAKYVLETYNKLR